jgi:hypothetical protein
VQLAEHTQVRQDAEAARPSRLVARLPLVLVAAPVVFNLWTLRAEVTTTQNLNDGSMHLSMVRWAMHRIQAGHLPFDGWYPYLGEGFGQFHQYQSLPHILTGAAATLIGANHAYFGSLYLLLSLWPVCIYFSARLFGFDRWTAAGAALVSPFLASTAGYGFEQGSYTWQGYGMWAQLWGMWLLPISLALTYRAVNNRKYLTFAAIALGLTFATHFLAGYLGALALGVWVLVEPKHIFGRLVRAAIVGAVGLLSITWMLVPLFADKDSANYSNYGRHTFWYDSYGARKVLGWLVRGEIYDHHRWPVVTMLVAIGIVVAARRARREVLYRAILGFWLLSLILFIGRPTFGAAFDALPGQNDLFLPRFIMGVHLGGLFLAGIAIAWLAEVAIGVASRTWRVPAPAATIAACVTCIVVLAPAWTHLESYATRGASWIRIQHHADAIDGADFRALVEHAKALGGGRIYAGLRTNWGAKNTIGFVPAYAELVNADADSVGFTLRVASLSTPAEQFFDDTNNAHYDLYNARYLVLPIDHLPPQNARLIERRGRHRLYEMPTSGYLQVVDSVGPPIVADSETLGAQTIPFLSSKELQAGRYPTVALNGNAAAPPSSQSAPTGNPGRVAVQYSQPEDGKFGGQVIADRNAVVMLKASFHARWKVRVDGKETKTQMLAPGFVGVAVTPGQHTIQFWYASYPRYDLLFAMSMFSVLALAFFEYRPDRRRRARRAVT